MNITVKPSKEFLGFLSLQHPYTIDFVTMDLEENSFKITFVDRKELALFCKLNGHYKLVKE